MGMERDPNDGAVTFIEVRTVDFQISTPRDVLNLFRAMFEAGALASKELGHIVYPVYKIEKEN